MIRKILVAYDGSENATRALDLATELTDKLGARLLIMHVLMHGRPPSELVHMSEVEHLVEHRPKGGIPQISHITGEHYELLAGSGNEVEKAQVISAIGKQLIAQAKQRCLDSGVTQVETLLRSGDRSEEILTAAKNFEADMIVLGSRGLGAIKGVVLGSVSQKILHHATCCVATVR